jgi:hypothetical protein
MKYLILISFVALSQFVQAGDGDHVGNGGDADEILIANITQEIEASFKTYEQQFPEVNFEQLKQAFRDTNLRVVEEDLFNGQGIRRTAINQPLAKKILVDRRLWQPIRDQAAVSVPLIFHEYLGILGIEIEEYKISTRMGTAALNILSAAQLKQDIYYFMKGQMKRPLPLFKSSVVFDLQGQVKSGVVAKPARWISNDLDFVVLQGDEFKCGENNFGCYTGRPFSAGMSHV